MATVGEKRGPRLPMGPKPNEVADLYKDDVELGEVVEPPKPPEVAGAPISQVAAITAAPGEVIEGDFKELKRPKVPLPPAKTINPPDVQLFYKWYASLTPEHLAQIICYMYRTHPVIDRKPPKQKYIDCFQSPIDDQWVLENHGTGNYMVIVNDSGLDKKTRTITTVYIRVQNPIYPPKINMYDLDTNHPDNRVYVERCIIEGKLKGDKTPMAESPMVSGGGGGSGNDALVMLLDKMISRMDRQQFANVKDPRDEAISAAFSIIAKGTESSTRMMLDNMKEQDPTKLLGLITAIIEMTKQPQQPQGGGMGDMLKLMELMDKRADSNMLLMKTMFEANKPEKGEDDGLDKFLDRITKLQDLGGLFGGGGGKKGTLETVLEYGMPVLGSIAQAAQSFFAMRAGMQPQTTTANPGGVPQNTTSQIPRTLTQSPAQQTNPQQQANAQQTSQPQQQTNSPEAEMLLETQIRYGLKQLTPMLVLALQRKDDEGKDFDGSQFAEGIDNTYGAQAYDMLAGLGKAKMLEFMKGDAESWAQLSPFEARLDKFLDEFLEYGKPDAAGAAGDKQSPNTPSREEQEAVFDISNGKSKPQPKPKGGKQS